MGTSLALAGAYNLAGALTQNPDDIPAALAQYEEAQRPLVDPAMRLSPALGLLFGNDKPWQIWLTNYFAACMALCAPLLKLLIHFIKPETRTPTLREYGLRTAS